MSRVSRPRWRVLLVVAVAIPACGRDPVGGQAGPGGRGGASDAGSMGSGGRGGVDGGSGRGGTAVDAGFLPIALVGQPCTAAAECATGFCANGVCCFTPCTSGCASCNQPGSAGTCMPLAPGTVCQPGRCAGGDMVEDQSVCDGWGACVLGPLHVCHPFRCDSSANQCFTTCTIDVQCALGRLCINGSCARPPGGAPCTANNQCVSGFCVDGNCCESACQGACRACNLVGREGTCLPIAAGTPDPRGICLDQGAASCSRSGLCDGVGGCSLYPAQTVCAAPTCVGNTLTPSATCNGRGSCVPQSSVSCAPYQCGNGVCDSHPWDGGT